MTTIKTIANLLGISPSTVSRALNNRGDISRVTREAVLDTAKSLNYNLNTVASSLRTRRTKLIGVIIPDITHYLYSTILNGFYDFIAGNGYHLVLAQSKNSLQLEEDLMFSLFSRRIDGILVLREGNWSDDFYNSERITDLPILTLNPFSKKAEEGSPYELGVDSARRLLVGMETRYVG